MKEDLQEDKECYPTTPEAQMPGSFAKPRQYSANTHLPPTSAKTPPQYTSPSPTLPVIHSVTQYEKKNAITNEHLGCHKEYINVFSDNEVATSKYSGVCINDKILDHFSEVKKEKGDNTIYYPNDSPINNEGLQPIKFKPSHINEIEGRIKSASSHRFHRVPEYSEQCAKGNITNKHYAYNIGANPLPVLRKESNERQTSYNTEQAKKIKQKCRYCQNHGISVAVNGHKLKCLNRDCKCSICQMTSNVREIMKHQQRVYRHEKSNFE